MDRMWRSLPTDAELLERQTLSHDEMVSHEQPKLGGGGGGGGEEGLDYIPCSCLLHSLHVRCIHTHCRMQICCY